MDLICYLKDNECGVEIRPGPGRRDWMDNAQNRAPYRCAPLVVANGFGWELLSPVGFSAIWNGGQDKEGLIVLEDVGTTPAAHSHFGEGILTFTMPMVFRTDPGTDLIVQGPMNRPKDAIAPLSGVVESDWGPFSFTMNWKFTRANTAIRFDEGEPFCNIIPIRRGALEEISPKLIPISKEPSLQASHAKWLAARVRFNEDLTKEGSEARAIKWQKHYQRGMDPNDISPAPDSHRTKSSLRPFQWFDPEQSEETKES